MDTMYSAWIQQHSQESQPVLHHDQRSPSVADPAWKDSPSSSAGTNGAGTSASAQSSLDLNEFGLGDITAAISHHAPSTSSSTTTSVSPSSSSYTSFPQYGYYVPGPYNATPYGSSQWNSSVPLSSYSSLNGATTSNGQSSQTPSSVQQMIIDPALTMNGSSTTTQYNISSNLQQRPQYQYHNLAINPAYVQGYPQTQSPVSNQQQSQTLSPYVLHGSPVMDSLNPSSFYAGTQAPLSSSPSQLTPQARQEMFSTTIRPLLQPNQFTGAGAVLDLTDRIIALGMVEMETPLRLEILTKIRDNAGNHYFRAWVENEDAMEITREWLKAAAKGDDQLAETVMPLLHIIDRLPWSLDSLRKAKLGKIILKLTKEATIPAIKDMASNLERKWRQMLSSSKDDAPKKGDGEISEDAKLKKRKLSEPLPKVGPPTKKIAIASTSMTKTVSAVKKEMKSSVTAVKDAKSDSSFFSAPKPKPKLPSFKKAPGPIKKDPDANIAQPSSVDPFQEALKSMGKARKETVVASPAQVISTTVSVTSSGLTKAGKKKKSVSWAPEDRLEQVKFIERAVYDDDPVDGTFFGHNIRDLDRDEGAALHAHLFEELIDWFEPLFIDIPPDIEAPSRGEESQERIAQEEREQIAPIALYMSAAQIPDSAAEPSQQIPEDQVDVNVRLMVTGSDVDSIFWTGQQPAAVDVEPASVSQLVQQLGVTSQNSMDAQDPSKTFPPLDPNLLSTVAGFGNVTPEQLTQILASLAGQNGYLGQQQGGGGAQSIPPYSAAGDQNWNMNQYGGGEYAYDESNGHESRRFSSDTGWEGRGRGGRRGRGSGRGGALSEAYKDSRKRKPCTFFAQGRCRYGDQCDFSHEPVY